MKIKMIHGIWVDEFDYATALQERADQDMRFWARREQAKEAGRAWMPDESVYHLPNKNNLRLWVKALRSDAYEQIDRTLESVRRVTREIDGAMVTTREVRYCCLGVACRVAIGAEQVMTVINVLTERDPEYPRVDVESTVFDGNPTTLSERMQVWLGVNDATLTLSTLKQSDDYVSFVNHPTLGVVEVEGTMADRYLSPVGHSENFAWTQNSRDWLMDARAVAATELNDEAKFTFKMIADIAEFRFGL